MHANPVVARAAEIKAAKRLHYAADDARDWPEVTRTGLILTNLELTERDIAPTSNGCAGQKLRNVAADWRREWFPMDQYGASREWRFDWRAKPNGAK